ncbi:MAG: hypothetical protein E8D43_00395 [Nitrospira sp.]|nr:MAG: hypothetical protein E8D43_00395 [Nitrospira sp.]
MDIVGLIHSTYDEACPQTSLEGFFEPTGDQVSLVDSNGRIVAALLDLIEFNNPAGTLATAALLELNRQAGFTHLPGVAIAVTSALINAISDLLVTGENALTSFRRRAANIGEFRSHLRERVTARLASDALGSRIRASAPARVAVACDRVIDRALEVHWALHGPSGHRAEARPGLGWLAVSAEHDTPTRPVNVPGALWPTADSVVQVEHDDRTISARVRYALAGAGEAITELDVLGALPPLGRVPLIPDDALVMVFLHGHSSRLEEAGGIVAGLAAEFHKYQGMRPLVVISFDFPTHGYAQYIDHDELSPYTTTTRFVPDRPGERRFGMLEYLEKLSVALVEQINADAVSQGQTPFLDRLVAFIGGSMGGNLALRLSERLVTNADWLKCLIAWSPASTYGSFGRAEGAIIPIPSPGEHVDILGSEALDRTHDRALQSEGDGSRGDFIRIQLEGEQVLNDATDSFRFWIHMLIGFLGPPNITFNILAHSLAATWIGSMVPLRQSDSWLRSACRASYNLREAEQSARLSLQETYNSARRRMHWRVANEQLLFSHQDEIAVSRGRPCYEVSSIPTLLIAGANDITDAERFDIYNSSRKIAPQMRANAGTGMFIASTGHSIHAERPTWLSRQVVQFLSGKLTVSGTARLVSAVRRDTRDRTAHLCAARSHWSPIAVGDVIADIRAGRFQYFVLRENQETPTRIEIAEREGSVFLRTETSPSSDDNLDNLPLWSVRRLEITFLTGGDNLRGGEDNLHVHVHLRDGTVVSRHNVNGRGEWGGGSVNLVDIALPDNTEPQDLLRIELETNFGGGIGGENWSMATMSVRALGDGFDKEVGYWGFMRFTGDSHRLSVPLNPTPPAPGEVDRLFLTFVSGDDGLRGVHDNIALTIHYAGGHTQLMTNINGGNEWSAHSTHEVEMFLDRPVTIDQILRLQFENSFSGGLSSDNWDMQSLTVRAVGNNVDREVASFGYFYFSGSQRVLFVPVSALPTPPGHVDSLRFEFTTSDDNLMGGSDNIKLWIEYTDGRVEEAFNINNGVRWPDHSATTADIALSRAVLPEAFRLLRLSSTFSGGYRGDNWNMSSVRVTASGSDTAVELTRYGFKRFTGSDRHLNLPIALARPGEINMLEFTFVTGDDNLRGGNDNISLTVRYDDGFSQLSENINGGARWHNSSTHTVLIPLARAVRPEALSELVIEAGFGGGVAGDNWNMQSLVVRALGNDVEREVIRHGFRRFRGDDTVLSLPLVIGPPGSATQLRITLRTGGDNLRGDTDNLHVTLVHQGRDGLERLFFRNINGGERWHNNSLHIAVINLPIAIRPLDMQRLEFETWFAGGSDGDNWNMDFLTARVTGLDLDQPLTATGFKRFTGEDSRLNVPIGLPGLVSELQFEFHTGYDNLRGDSDNVHAHVHFADGSSTTFLNINNRFRWTGHSQATVFVNLPSSVAFSHIQRIELQTTFGGGSHGDNWDMAEVHVTALGNSFSRPLFNHGFKRFTGDDQRLVLNHL